MEQDQSIETLKFIIERYDSYFNSVNIKARFLIGLATFIVATFIYKINYFTNSLSNDCLIYLQYVLIGIVLITCFFIIYKVSASVFPYLENDISDSKKSTSLIFFEDVAKIDDAEVYKEKFYEDEHYDLEVDLAEQVLILARGLNKKFKRIREATIALYVAVGAIILISVIKIGSTL